MTMNTTFFRFCLGFAFLLGSALVSCAQTNPNAFTIEEGTTESKTFAGLDLTSTDYKLVKTGLGTLTMTDSLAGFKTAAGSYISVEILEGPAKFTVKENSAKITSNITIGSATTTAAVTAVGKPFGEHYGSFTIYNGSSLNFTSIDTTIADGNIITMVGGGTISGSQFNLRSRNNKMTTFCVTGADADALISASFRMIEGGLQHTLDVQEATSTLTISGQITDFGGDYSNKGLRKIGAGTLVLTKSNSFALGGLTVEGGTLKLGGANNNGSTVGKNFLELRSGTTATALADNVFGSGNDAGIPNVIVAGTLITFGTTNLKTLTLTNGTVNPTVSSDSLVFAARTNGVAQKVTSAGTSRLTTKLILNTDTEFAVTGTLSIGTVTGTATLLKTGAGTLNFLVPSFATTAAAAGTFHIQEGTAIFPAGKHTENWSNVIVGSDSTTATLTSGYKTLGDHFGSLTIFNGSKFTNGTDLTLADSNTLTFVGGGSIVGSADSYYLFRNRKGGKATTVAVAGANATASIQENAFWFVEKAGNGVVFDVQDASASLTLKGLLFTHGTTNSLGYVKTGDGTLILDSNGQTYATANSNANLHQFRGSVTVSDGTLRLASDDALSTNLDSLTLSADGSLDLAGKNQTLARILGTGNVVNSVGTPSTLTLGVRKNSFSTDSKDPVYVDSTFSATTGDGIQVETYGKFTPLGASIADTLTIHDTLELDLDALQTANTTALTASDIVWADDSALSITYDSENIPNYQLTNIVKVEEPDDLQKIFQNLELKLNETSFGYYFNLLSSGDMIALSLDFGAVPEPSCILLFLTGLGGIAGIVLARKSVFRKQTANLCKM